MEASTLDRPQAREGRVHRVQLPEREEPQVAESAIALAVTYARVCRYRPYSSFDRFGFDYVLWLYQLLLIFVVMTNFGFTAFLNGVLVTY